jgi:hypothetical protein
MALSLRISEEPMQVVVITPGSERSNLSVEGADTAA